MTRFDSMLVALGLVCAIAFVERSWRLVPLATLALLLPLLPWIA